MPTLTRYTASQIRVVRVVVAVSAPKAQDFGTTSHNVGGEERSGTLPGLRFPQTKSA